ncbi:peptide-N-glycosidase F-related protein [Paenimyroides aestuarii]|uniref:Peptide-N-glycosidase F-related protein n=1 Tax=Paenimyroides aestuarii TaxID=2968490 RepID=A0ABY5NSI5_9FLAO|nr:peptide-N-glycosidase F-related protein [Paenimyroides aestuarii]UUV21357.1 peptide-N-glycosidase F-related protein [Paenimyroides aestuarii]
MKKIITLLFFSAFTLIACKDDEKTNDDPARTINVKTFDKVKVAFGDNLSQSAEGTFTFPDNLDNVKTIKMYIKDICPNKDCDEWDRYANIYAKDKATGTWYELGRFINPYWVGNEKLERGYEVDVTDFRSILSGTTELKIYTETWNAKGRTYSVEFDFEPGTPDYKYSAVVPVIQYNKSSIDGVPYGTNFDTNVFDLTKQITIPTNTEIAYFRTIISGWGHATPNDAGGRGCAEWCFRTHHILINGNPTFSHELKAIGCAQNPVNNQAPGNWKPERAGWCPGMVVPVRFNNIEKNMFGTAFNFEYDFEDWTNNNGNGNAFYAVSTFVVVKSNAPIEKPIVN